MNGVYDLVKEFKNKYRKTIVFRLKKHCSVIEKHLNQDEKVTYAFCAQKNHNFYMLANSCVIALTNKRIIIGHKRFIGYFYTSITPDMYNDIKVIRHIIWSNIELDTVKEMVYFSNIDPDGAIEVEKRISDFMMDEKRKYENI